MQFIHVHVVVEFLPGELRSRLLQVKELDESVKGTNLDIYMYVCT